MAWRVWVWLLLLSVLWGGSFFFAKVAVAELPPFTVVLGRVAVAALALNLALALSGQGLFRRGTPWRAYFAMGLLNNLVPFSLIFWAQTHISSGLASVLNATTPLFTVLVAHALTDDEKMTKAKVAAVVVGFAGVAVLIGPGTGVVGRLDFWSEVACLGAALSYAFAGVYGRRFTQMHITPLQAAAGQLTASATLILPVMMLVDRPWTFGALPSLSACSALIALALLSTALAYVLYFRILAAAGATNLLLVTFLIPVTAIVLGAAFFGERLHPHQVAGIALVAAGLAVAGGWLAAFLRRAK